MTIEDVLAGRAAWAVACGDSLDVLRTMPDGCVQCVVTSPPYYALRDYQTGTWEGGDAGCGHQAPPKRGLTHGTSSTLGPGRDGLGPDNAAWKVVQTQYRDACRRCGARRVDKQLGLEAAHDCNGWATGTRCGACFVCKMTAVFAEVRRVLRPDGTLWLNIGGGFASAPPGIKHAGRYKTSTLQGSRPGLRNGTLASETADKLDTRLSGLKPKDLLLSPERLALSLQADGWYVRSAITLCKVSPMPESVRDRPTRATEMLYLLSPSARYFYDADAERVALSVEPHAPGNQKWANGDRNDGDRLQQSWGSPVGRNLWDWWQWRPEGGGSAEHYATFPQFLPRMCINLGTPADGVCSACGATRRRVTERSARRRPRPNEYVKRTGETGTGSSCANTVAGTDVVTVGWEAGCTCGAPVTGALVLDPFAGTSTTGLVALRMGRRFVGVELSPKYAALSRRRLSDDLPLFAGAPSPTPAPADATLFPEEGVP